MTDHNLDPMMMINEYENPNMLPDYGTKEGIVHHPLFGDQIELEEKMRGMGIDRFRAAISKNAEKGRESQSKPAQRLMSKAHHATVDIMQTFMNEAGQGKAGARAFALRYMQMVGDADILAHVTMRCVFDTLSDTVPLVKTARQVAQLLEDELNNKLFKEAAPNLHRFASQNANKQEEHSRKLRHLFWSAKAANIELIDWSMSDKVKLGTKLIELFVEASGLFRLETVRLSGTESQLCLIATQETLDWIEAEGHAIEGLSPSYLPMIVPPRPWTDVYDGGYWTRFIRGATLIKTQNRAYLKELEGRDMAAVFAGVNALQETAWAINTRVLEVVRHYWALGQEIGKLPPRDDRLKPAVPAWLVNDTRPREVWSADEKAEFKGWKKSAAEVYAFNKKARGKRREVLGTLGVADLFVDREEIYFPHQLDWRGRAYPVPMYLNPQGSDLQKALLVFANVVPIHDQDAADWLAIHGAGLWGVDKVSMQERVDWIKAHEQDIIAVAADPYANRFWADAEKPWMALAFCFEWAGFVEEGFGFLSCLPVQMDGTCNGLQNFSAMLLDEVGGAAVNLVPSDTPSDVYRIVADRVNVQVMADAVEGNEIAAAWVGHVTRKVTKRPVMTLAYGAKKFGFVKQIEEDTLKPWREGELDDYPFNLWDEEKQDYVDRGGDAARYLGALIWDAVGNVVIAARAAMDWLQGAARMVCKSGLPVSWVTPTGLLVQQNYRKSEVKRLNLLFGGVRIAPRMVHNLDEVDGRQQAAGIAPNWVHSLDASHMMLTIHRAVKEGIKSFSMIHDSYGTHAGNAAALALYLREEFIHMYTGVDCLAQFREAVKLQVEEPDEVPELPAKGNLDLAKVADSVFFFA